ncbi:MAG: DPP IV N-terminal domain-containing protein [Myxococcota bacterium]
MVGAILAGHALAAAPQKPPPQTLKELSVTLNHTLGRPFSFQFTPDGQTLLYLRSGARDRDSKLYAFDVASKQERLVASAEALLGGTTKETAAERAARERKRIKLSGLSSYTLSSDGSKILISNSGQVFLHDLKKDRTDRIQLPEGELANPKLSPDGSKLAFVLDYNLHVARLGTPTKKGIKTRITRLTRGGTATKPFGLAEFVAQEEMSRHEGFWWSPDSKRILYQATDQSELDRFTIADAAAPEKSAEVFPYPRAGHNNADVRLFLVNTSGRRRTEVRWNRSTWTYVAKVAWPDGGDPTVLLQARDQRAQIYVRIDAKSGSTTKLHDEEDAAWLNIHDSTPWWLEDGSYLWASETDGAWALYRYTPREKRAGIKQKRVVVGPDVGFNTLLHVDEAGGWVWFSGGLDPTQNHIFRAPLDGGYARQMTDEDGYSDATVSPDGARLVITHASLAKLPQSHLYTTPKEVTGKLESKIKIPQTSSSPKRLPSVERVAPEKAGGFHAAIIRPRNFDPTQKYPVILYVYGGPGAQVVRSIAHGYMVQQWMADHGFLVVSIDGRGTPRRGREYERAIRLRFGDVPLEDQVKGLTALGKNYPQLDLDRVGIYGWSFGGYMAALGALRRPDIFKVAVAGAPVVDWTYYDTHYTERYLGLPQQEAEAYRQSNLLTYAKHLKVPLMLVHGIADDNVYFAHSLLLADALFKAGRRFELVPLVGLTHQVSDPKVREVLYDRIVQFMGAVLW